MKSVLVISFVALALGCTAHQAPTAPADVTVPRNPEFRNVQVLPHTMSKDQLLEAMRRFTQALNVGCDHCHVVTATQPKQEFDFPSDAKEPKRVARVMIQMTHQINGAWMERVEAAEDHDESGTEVAETPGDLPAVNCWTCHRGQREPAMPPPLPPRT